MSNHVDQIEPVGSSGQSMSLSDVTDNISSNAGRTEAVSDAFDQAMTRAMNMPGGDSPVANDRNVLSGAQVGEVGAEKASVVSDVARDGAPEVAGQPDDSLDPVADRFRALYSEMTNWQVAWSIAQRTQQDTNQLLKGS